jgi:hypothetical protein
MDPILFKQLLAEMAETEIPKVTGSGEIKSLRGRGRPTAEEQYQEEHEEVFLEMFDGKNPTITPVVTKLKIKSLDCPDCGKNCPNGRQVEIKYYTGQPRHVNHQRMRCLECNMYRHPETKEFSVPQGPASAVYLAWAKHEFSVRNKQAKTETDK